MVTLNQFQDAVRGVLLKGAKHRKKYENRKPTKAELERKWQLKRRKR